MIYINSKNRPAFTLLELVFVIVILGIIAAMTLPRLERDLKQEAADSILSDIRYTQHLALMDNMHEFDNPQWQRKFWKIMFYDCTGDHYYMVGSDSNVDSGSLFDENEAATDPVNGKPMFNSCGTADKSGYSDRIFITDKYGITNVTNPIGACSNNNANKYIGFDHLGRPHYGFQTSSTPNYASYINSTCRFTFTLSDGDTFSIDIEPETGYAFIVGQTGS